MRKKHIAAACLVAVLGIGCNNDNVPTGTATTVMVRAFADVDGSGGYSTGDIPLTGTVTLTATGAASGSQATLDASGAAFFEGVAPGSYSATITATPPAGAVLATASAASVIVPFSGGEIEAQFRYVFNPGTISGRIFKDVNTNGTYESGTDTPAPGLTVSLYTGTDTTATPVALTSSGTAGDFTFTALRAGTYTVKESTFPTITMSSTTQRVTVTSAVTSAVAVTFTGNLLVTLAAVRAAPSGTTVAFTAVATQNAGLFASNNLYVQDATGGVLIFGAPVTGTVAGDTVRIIGATTVFNGEIEITAPAGGAVSVTKLGTGPVPAPISITIPQLIGNTFGGRLVKVLSATVRSVVTTSGTAYNVNMQGATPADTFQVRLTNTTNIPGLPSSAWIVGQSYDVTGVDGYFNGLPQLKPRSAADMSIHITPLTIAAAKNVSNDTVNVVGVVTASRGTFRTDNGYIQDATGGVQIFNLPLSLTLALGDSVLVHGKMTVFSNESEITNNVTPTDSIKVTKLGTAAVPAPAVITGAQLLSRAHESKLVTVQNVTIVTVGAAGGTGTYTVTGTAPDGSSITVFMSAPTGAVPPPATTFTVGQRYNITAIAVPFTVSGVVVDELKPRGAADVVQQ